MTPPYTKPDVFICYCGGGCGGGGGGDDVIYRVTKKTLLDFK